MYLNDFHSKSASVTRSMNYETYITVTRSMHNEIYNNKTYI